MAAYDRMDNSFAEVERQMWLAIESKRQWLSRKAGRDVGLDVAKRAFLMADMDAWLGRLRQHGLMCA